VEVTNEVRGRGVAPFGSVYHHFPGGKEQLGAEVIASAGAVRGLRPARNTSLWNASVMGCWAPNVHRR
jgi:hypothetical protein